MDEWLTSRVAAVAKFVVSRAVTVGWECYRAYRASTGSLYFHFCRDGRKVGLRFADHRSCRWRCRQGYNRGKVMYGVVVRDRDDLTWRQVCVALGILRVPWRGPDLRLVESDGETRLLPRSQPT